MQHSKKVLNKKPLITGFSLPELLVTIALITIVTAVVLFNYSSFNSSVLLTSQAYELALDVRETQVFGLSVRAEGLASNRFKEEYGLNFISGTGNYTLFQDNGTSVPAGYNSGVDTILDTLSLDPRFTIQRICMNDQACPAPSIASDIAVTFKRPDFDAKFNSVSYSGSIDSVYLEISPINDPTATRMVNVTNTGQISVVNY